MPICWVQMLVLRYDYVVFQKTSVRWQKEAEKYGISTRVFRLSPAEHPSGDKWVKYREEKYLSGWKLFLE